MAEGQYVSKGLCYVVSPCFGWEAACMGMTLWVYNHGKYWCSDDGVGKHDTLQMLRLPQDSREERTYCALKAGQGFLSTILPAYTKVGERHGWCRPWGQLQDAARWGVQWHSLCMALNQEKPHSRGKRFQTFVMQRKWVIWSCMSPTEGAFSVALYK